MGAFSHNFTQALLGGAAAAVFPAAGFAAGFDCTFFGAILTSFSLSCAIAVEADIATAIAKTEASALPLMRNSAFPINVKILACLQADVPALPLVAAQMF
jgi:hypothetical protein